MERRKVILTRLRSVEYYKGEPLNHIIDSMYHLLNNFIVKNKDDFLFDTHNCSIPSNQRKRNVIRDYEILEDSDVLIIPSEAEFTYNIFGSIDDRLMGRTW